MTLKSKEYTFSYKILITLPVYMYVTKHCTVANLYFSTGIARLAIVTSFPSTTHEHAKTAECAANKMHHAKLTRSFINIPSWTMITHISNDKYPLNLQLYLLHIRPHIETSHHKVFLSFVVWRVCSSSGKNIPYRPFPWMCCFPSTNNQ